jgi:hypothetical protein
VQPADGFESTRWLIFPWNTRFAYNDGYDQAEFNLWLTINFMFHHNDDGTTANPLDVLSSDPKVFTNWSEDANPRVEDMVVPRFNALWERLLGVGRPLSGREAIEIIAAQFMPMQLDANHRRYWWRLLRDAMERGFARELKADGRLYENAIATAIRFIARHVRYYMYNRRGSLDRAGQVFDDPDAPWADTPGAVVENRDTYYPQMIGEHGTVPTDLFLYTEESMAMSFVGACTFAYGRAALAGLIMPHALFVLADTRQPMGEPNLPQFRHATADDRLEDEAIAGRAALLRIMRARRGGSTPNLGDVRIIEDAQDRLKRFAPSDEHGEEKKNQYLRWFAAALRQNDRLDGTGYAPLTEPTFVEQREGRLLMREIRSQGTGAETMDDQGQQRRRWTTIVHRQGEQSKAESLASFSGAPENDSLLYDRNDQLPLTDAQGYAIADAMERLALG